MSKADQVRERAEYVRNNPNNAQAIADALDLIADAMDGAKTSAVARGQWPGIGVDAPDVGKDPIGANSNVGA